MRTTCSGLGANRSAESARSRAAICTHSGAASNVIAWYVCIRVPGCMGPAAEWGRPLVGAESTELALDPKSDLTRTGPPVQCAGAKNPNRQFLQRTLTGAVLSCKPPFQPAILSVSRTGPAPQIHAKPQYAHPHTHAHAGETEGRKMDRGARSRRSKRMSRQLWSDLPTP